MWSEVLCGVVSLFDLNMDLTVLQLLTCLKAAGKETYLEKRGEGVCASDSAVTSWYISGVHDGEVQLSYKGIKNLWAFKENT